MPDLSEAEYLKDLAERVARAWPRSLPRQINFPHGRQALTAYLHAWAHERPAVTAINFYGHQISYAELDDVVLRCAAALVASGVAPGDRVAVFMPNCPQFTIAFMGILQCGAIVVPVNPMVRELELAHYLDDSGANTIIAQDRLHSLIMATEAGARARVILTGLCDFLPEHPTLRTPPGLDGKRALPADAADFLALLQDASRTGAFPLAKWDTPAVINYTGGTTGLPKGCLHTHGDMVFTGACVGTYHLCVQPGAVTLCYLPLFWIAGELNGILEPIVNGSSVVLLNRWDAETVMEAIARYGVTGLAVITDGLVEIMDHPRIGDVDLRSLTATMVASFTKTLNPDYRARWQALTGVVVKEGGYGMTETNTADTFTTGLQDDNFDLHAEPMFVGLPCPGTELKIADHLTGQLLPLGEPGEICIRTPSLMKYYWGKPEASGAAIRDGWYHTGDSGVIDEAGFLSFRGRKKEMLKVNGMSVFPAEVESLLARHPSIESCGVVGRADEARGQMPVAFVTLKPEAFAVESAEAIHSWCRANMAIYKVPDIRVITDMPRTATGKVKRQALADLL